MAANTVGSVQVEDSSLDEIIVNKLLLPSGHVHSPEENALTLLHKLGHVLNHLARAGGFKLSDADNNKLMQKLERTPSKCVVDGL